jgi:hypothetical protein
MERPSPREIVFELKSEGKIDPGRGEVRENLKLTMQRGRGRDSRGDKGAQARAEREARPGLRVLGRW